MQKVTPKPYAPPKTGGTGKSIRLFSLRFHFISNRHALPETGTGVTQKPAYSVFDSILLNIVRNICPLVKRKTLPAEHFVQKNKNRSGYGGHTPQSKAEGLCFSSAYRDAPLVQRQGGVFRLPPPYLWTPPTPQRNNCDRRQRRKQGAAVGAAASKTRVPPKARSGCWVPQPVAKGCTPLTILKKKSKHKKASAAPVGAIALTLFSLLHL